MLWWKTCVKNSYHHCWFRNDRASPEEAFLTRQPFLPGNQSRASDRWLVGLAQLSGRWESLLSGEQTAYALGQVIADHLLPPLESVRSGHALLDYRVRLRDCLDSFMVEELVSVLAACGADHHWQQIETSVYASVIYDRVAACIDLQMQDETLYLRWDDDLADAINRAHAPRDIPLSLKGLQQVLYERFNALLIDARSRAFAWLAG